MLDQTVKALVSIWNRPNSFAAEHFLCSGTLIDASTVLTVAHVCSESTPLWISVYGTPNSYPVTQSKTHPDLDIALLSFDGALLDICPIQISQVHPTGDLDKKLTLNGYFEGRLQAPQGVRVLAYSEMERHYLMDVKQPIGQSGAAICLMDRLWGVATCHYTDANVHRGCVIAAYQFESWWEGLRKNRRTTQQSEAPLSVLSVEAWEILLITALGIVRTTLNKKPDRRLEAASLLKRLSTDLDCDEAVSRSLIESMKHRRFLTEVSAGRVQMSPLGVEKLIRRH